MCPRKGAIQKCFDKRDFELIPQALRNRTLCLHQAWCCSQGFEIWASRSVSNHVSQARLLILQTSDVSFAKKVYMCAPADQDEFKKVQQNIVLQSYVKPETENFFYCILIDIISIFTLIPAIS